MNALKPNRGATTLIVATSLLLGVCTFLAAKIVNPPPIDPLDVEFWDLLGTQAAVLNLERSGRNGAGFQRAVCRRALSAHFRRS